MRDTLIRVNIVLLKEQHQRFQEYAQRYHGSLSQFLRLAGENEIDQHEDTNEIYLRPIMEQQEKLQQALKKINHQLKSTRDSIYQSTDFNQMNIKKIALEIEEILFSSDTPLSIPEIREYISHSQDDLITGIEWLLDHGRIKRMKQINAPSKYKITGDVNE